MKDKKWLYILSAVFIVEFSIIIYCNIFLGEKNINADSAMEYVHAIEMARTHKLLIPEWEYTTALGFDAPLFLAVPLFMVTNDIYISFGISSVLLLCLWIAVIYMLFRKRNKIAFLLSVILFLIPYRKGMLDYFNMMLFGYAPYMVKVLIPLCLVALLIGYDSVKEGRKDRIRNGILFGVYIFLLFTSSFASGVYVFVCGIIPVLLGYFLYTIYCGNQIPKYFYIVLSVSVLCFAAGWGLQILFGLSSKGNSMSLCTVDYIWDNIRIVIQGIFQLFDAVAYENIDVLSYRGIDILIRTTFVYVLIGFAIVALVKAYKKELDRDKFLLLSIFVWNLVILFMCNTSYKPGSAEYRYHIMGIVPLLCVVSSLCVEQWEKLPDKFRNTKRNMALLVLLGVIALNITSFVKVLRSNTDEDIAYCKEICEYAVENSIEGVYFLANGTGARICRLLDYESGTVYMNSDEAGERIYVIDYYSTYNNDKIVFDKFIYVINVEKYDIGESIKLFDKDMKEKFRIGKYGIYVPL